MDWIVIEAYRRLKPTLASVMSKNIVFGIAGQEVMRIDPTGVTVKCGFAFNTPQNLTTLLPSPVGALILQCQLPTLLM